MRFAALSPLRFASSRDAFAAPLLLFDYFIFASAAVRFSFYFRHYFFDAIFAIISASCHAAAADAITPAAIAFCHGY